MCQDWCYKKQNGTDINSSFNLLRNIPVPKPDILYSVVSIGMNIPRTPF